MIASHVGMICRVAVVLVIMIVLRVRRESFIGMFALIITCLIISFWVDHNLNSRFMCEVFNSILLVSICMWRVAYVTKKRNLIEAAVPEYGTYLIGVAILYRLYSDYNLSWSFVAVVLAINASIVITIRNTSFFDKISDLFRLRFSKHQK